jgi:predicted acyl esterase
MKKITFLLFFVLSSCFIFAYYPVKIETRLASSHLKYLNADLYTRDTNRPKPVILIQTPYNKNLYHRWESGNVEVPLIFDTLSYNYVIMDWRGFYSNKSADTTGYNRGLDGFDAVEWIAKQKWCNGKVGTWGGSALGMVQFWTAFENPPHLVCAAPFIKDFRTSYNDYFYGGVYRKEHTETIIRLGFALTPALILSHPSKDALWQTLEKMSNKADKVSVPMLMATGWFDLFPGDVILDFEELLNRSDKKVRNQHKMIVGPWLHTRLGKVQQGVRKFPEAEAEQDKMAKLFFDYYLMNAKNGYPLKPKLTYFEMGSNQWLYGNSWSGLPRSSDTLYLRLNGRLLETPPSPVMGPKAIPPDTIVYDPRNPSPTFGGARFNPFDFSLKIGPQDISQIVESRNDVLIYTSDYSQDGFVINGAVKIQLYVSSDRKDTDFGVRMTEVMRDGQSIILTQGIKRMRFRESLSEEKLMEPDSIYLVEIELEPLSIRLQKDSRLRIVVSSSNYPMFDVNPNNGGELYQPGDSLIATNFVYHRNELPSRIIIPFIDQATAVATNDVQDNEIKIYPNPANDFINFNIKSGNSDYEIFDVRGMPAAKGITNGRINVSALPAGVYFIKFSYGLREKPNFISFCISR